MQTEPMGKPPQARKRRPGVGSLVRSLAIGAIAALVLGVTAAAAAAAPAVTVTPSADLVSGDTVTVEGTDFEPAFVPPPPFPGLDGLYVAQAANVGGEWKTGGSPRWIASSREDPEEKLSGDGSFKTTITVDRFLDSGAVDCLKVQCVILTWQAHGNPGDPLNPVFTETPIRFARSLLVDPRGGIPAGQTTTVNVSGVNYGPAIFPNGLKIAQAQADGNSYRYGPPITVTTTPDPTDPSQYLLTPEGYFAGEVEVAAKRNTTGGQIDCEFRKCHIIAWPADEEPTGGADGNVVAAEEIGFAFTYNPFVKLSQSRRLPVATDVTVMGSGFPAGQPGLYVTQAVRINGDWHTATRDTSGRATNMKFVMPNSPVADTRLAPDGSFTTSISVTRSLTLENGQSVSCLEVDCFVITWRAHTDPSRATLYTSSPIGFRERPVEPRINVVKRNPIRVGRSARSLLLAAVACGPEPCAVNRPNRVVLRVGKQRFRLALTGPRQVRPDRRAQVRLRLTGRAARALAGRRARVRFRVVARSESGNVARVVNRVLVGAPKAKRR